MDLSPLPDSFDGDPFESSLSLLGIEPRSSGTFALHAEGDLASAWEIWRETWFLPHLLPAFRDAHARGIHARTRELHGIDRDLEDELTETLRVRSHAAAAEFFEGKTRMRGNPEWCRFAEGVAAGKSPGNLPVVHALQSALYHVALAPAVTSYAWLEFRSRDEKAIASRPDPAERETFATILPHLRVALAEETGQDSEDSPRFRVV